MTEAAQRKAAGWPKLFRDTNGLAVRTKREMRNGLMIIPAGTYGVIDGGPSWDRMSFEGAMCMCCGVKGRMSRTSWRDYDVIKVAVS